MGCPTLANVRSGFPAQRIAPDIAKQCDAILQELVQVSLQGFAFVTERDQARILFGRAGGFNAGAIFFLGQNFFHDFAARRKIRVTLVNVGDKCIAAQVFVLFSKPRHRQRRFFSGTCHPSAFARQLPGFAVLNQFLLHQPSFVGVGRERKTAETIRNKIVAGSRLALASVKKQELLEIRRADRLIQCIQKFKQHTLAVEKHEAIYFIRQQTAMLNRRIPDLL